MGQYLSVDSRPVSSSRGIMQQIASLFKSYLRSAYAINSHQKLMDPFMCLNIRCTLGSYDPNIEPAKDDVLFIDSVGVLKAMEAFFMRIYGEKQIQTMQAAAPKLPRLQDEHFELLRSRKSITSNPPGVSHHQLGIIEAVPIRSASLSEHRADQPIREPVTMEQSHSLDRSVNLENQHGQDAGSVTSKMIENPHRGTQWKASMYDDDDYDKFDDSAAIDQSQEPYDEAEESMPDDVSHKNPWTIAKLNAPVRQKMSIVAEQPPAIASDHQPVLTPERTGLDMNYSSSPATQGNRQNLSETTKNMLLTPLTSPASRRPGASDLSSPIHKPFSFNPRMGNGAEDPVRVYAAGNLAQLDDRVTYPEKGAEAENSLRVYVAGRVPEINDDVGGVDFTSAHNFQRGTSGFTPINSSVHPDLAITLDFEKRKEAAMQRRKEQLRQQTLDTMLQGLPTQSSTATPNSPHKNRYNKAKAALTHSAPSMSTLTSILEKGDPRGYLFHLMQREEEEVLNESPSQPTRLKRRKTAMLPFETIPEGQAMYNVVMTVDTTEMDLGKEVSVLAVHDEYVKLGLQSVGPDITIEETKRWDDRLHELIAMSFEKDGKEADMRTDLWSLVEKRLGCYQNEAISVD
jgi:hypothetical protein